MVYMQNKRPFSDDEHYQVSYKHIRQMDCNGHSSSLVDFFNHETPSKKPHISVDDVESKRELQDEERLASGGVSAQSAACEDSEKNAFDDVSSFASDLNNSDEEDFRSERSKPAYQISSSFGFFDHDLPTISLIQAEEFCASALNCPPRKVVPIGPDHQAEIPDCEPVKTSVEVAISASAVDENSEELMGTCIIPMPDVSVSTQGDHIIGQGRANCCCPDEGSIRCVRQHVMEARKELMEVLGKDKFVELGFNEMGEDIAWKWTEEEEQVFNEVVFSNPASTGRNFWDHLSHVFPTRSKNELVSYYFNVFMLRKRADQNRMDLLNVDSDNDEWEGSVDGDDCEVAGGDEDCIIEPSADLVNLVYSDDPHGEDFHDISDIDDDEEDDDDGDDDDDDDDNGINNDNGGVAVCDVTVSNGISSGKSTDTPNSVSTNGCDDHDLKDDLCTSNEYQSNEAGFGGPCDADSMVHKNDVFSGVSNHKYVLDSYDVKAWEAGYFATSAKHIEFLPTCNMIKEVFGDESWNN